MNVSAESIKPRTAIVACRTLEQELSAAMQDTGAAYPIVWLESGLHNTPEKLRARLQESLDHIDADRVLLCMGFCGNAIAGVTARDFELIVPRVDDCITLLLGSADKRREIAQRDKAYFLTEGWLKGERNLWVEHQYAVEKYGEETAKAIAEAMYGHYRTLALLDCGLQPMDTLIDKTKIIADTLALTQKIVPASTGYILELLRGPWDAQRFLTVPAGGRICMSDLTETLA